MKSIRIQYFAILRESAGRSDETVRTRAQTAAQLYGELLDRYGFSLQPEQLRVVINDELEAWTTPLHDGDEVVFLPPVAGG